MRFVYCAYRPEDEPSLSVQPQRAAMASSAAVANGLNALGLRARRILWRSAALGGMVLASLLLVEEAMSADTERRNINMVVQTGSR
ncbi:MAG: hypothetical protein AMJ69_05550 [Gammaproteobacteria bacterium SG8_47]|nr:MAG: hypothetical protein AMJ69_05550 [Gammaproteobacteria bacterium SG8_47]